MQTNVGTIDRIVRIVAGVGIVGATYANMLPIWGYVAVVPVVTAFVGFCPIYTMFGLSTCPAKR